MESAAIPARSEKQAMDWSLVLASQGIEAVIERIDEGQGWRLVVDALNQSRAESAIRLYRAENRSQIWRRRLPGTELVFDSRSLAWLFLLVVFSLLDAARGGSMRDVGVMDNSAVRAGEWWRLFTATMLHADVAHLATNVTIGVLLLGLAMGSFGPGLGILAAFLAGVGGNLAGLLFYPDGHRGLGASGMVMGALGLLAAQSFSVARAGLPAKQLAVRSFAAGILLLILMGFNPGTDVLAHSAGFMTGAFLGGVLVLLPARVTRTRWLNHLAELVCGGLVLWTWWRAFS